MVPERVVYQKFASGSLFAGRNSPEQPKLETAVIKTW